jgi:hypothetical protein
MVDLAGLVLFVESPDIPLIKQLAVREYGAFCQPAEKRSPERCPEPVPDRKPKALLFPVQMTDRKEAGSHGLEQAFSPEKAVPVRRRQTQDVFGQFMIQKRRSNLQAVSHGSNVYLGQDIIWQENSQIYVLELFCLRQTVQTAMRPVKTSCRVVASKSPPQFLCIQIFFHVLGEYGVSEDKTLCWILARPFHEPFQLADIAFTPGDVWQPFYTTFYYPLTERVREFLIRFNQPGAVQTVISCKYLISTVSA